MPTKIVGLGNCPINNEPNHVDGVICLMPNCKLQRESIACKLQIKNIIIRYFVLQLFVVCSMN
jgi:hypothetical protein